MSEDRARSAPLAGVMVILHDLAGGGVLQTRVTDVDGVADFGDVGTERVTVSVAYEDNRGPLPRRLIQTGIDIPVGDYRYLVEPLDDPNVDPLSECPGAPSFDATFNGAPPGHTIAFLTPYIGSGTFSNGTVSFPSAPLCPIGVQSDGTVSLIATTSTDTTPAEFSYGFVVDQPVAASYTGVIDRVSEPVPYRVSPADATSLALFVRRKGVQHLLNGGTRSITEPGAGTFAVATEFPADAYTVLGVRIASQGAALGSGFTSQVSFTSFDSLPGVFDVTVPDYVFSDVTFNAASRTYAWQLTATSDVDTQLLQRSFSFQGSSLEHFVYFDPATRNLALGPLVFPEPVRSWENEPDLVDFSQQLSVSDSTLRVGYEAAVRAAFAAGPDPIDEAPGVVSQGIVTLP